MNSIKAWKMNTDGEKKGHGGRRAGAGRPSNDRKSMISVRLSKEAVDKLNRLTKNKSEYLENLIKSQHEGDEDPV